MKTPSQMMTEAAQYLRKAQDLISTATATIEELQSRVDKLDCDETMTIESADDLYEAVDSSVAECNRLADDFSAAIVNLEDVLDSAQDDDEGPNPDDAYDAYRDRKHDEECERYSEEN